MKLNKPWNATQHQAISASGIVLEFLSKFLSVMDCTLTCKSDTYFPPLIEFVSVVSTTRKLCFSTHCCFIFTPPGKQIIWPVFPNQTIIEGSLCSDTRQSIEAEIMKECCLLVYYPQLFLIIFSYDIGPTHSRVDIKTCILLIFFCSVCN